MNDAREIRKQYSDSTRNSEHHLRLAVRTDLFFIWSESRLIQGRHIIILSRQTAVWSKRRRSGETLFRYIIHVVFF